MKKGNMSTYYVSFTNILGALHEGVYKCDQLSDSEAVIAVGCSMKHLFQSLVDEEGNYYVPYEVTWLNRDLPRSYGGPETKPWDSTPRVTGVARSECESHVLETWDRLAAILREKDEEGKLLVKIGNYPNFCLKKTREGHRCFYGGDEYEIPSWLEEEEEWS